MQGVTAQEKKFIEVFQELYKKNELTPSFSELAAAMKLKSKSQVCRLVDQLEAKGLLINHKHMARSIVLTLRTCPHCGK